VIRTTILIVVFLLTASASNCQPMKWKKLADGLVSVYVNTHLPNPTKEFGAIEAKDNIVIAGWASVVLSTDVGETWQPLIIPDMGSYVFDIDIYDNNTFVIGTDTGVFFTSDQGYSWKNLLRGNIKAVLFDGSPDKIVCIGLSGVALLDPNGSRTMIPFMSSLYDIQHGADNALYLLTTNGSKRIYKSVDHGISWNLLSEFTPGDLDCYSFICDKDDANRFVVVNEEWGVRNDQYSELFTSSNAGLTWNTTLETLMGSYTYLIGNSTQGCHDYFVGSNPEGILRSSDKGVTWSSIGGPSTPVDSRTICALDDSTIFAIDTFGSVWVTDASRVRDAGPLSTDSTFQKVSLELCDSLLVGKVVFYSSNGCLPSATIDSVVIIGQDASDYSFERPFSLPVVILDTLGICFRPSKVGTTDAKLKVTYSNGVVRYVDLSTTVTPPATVSFSNVSNSDIYTDILGDDITIPIQFGRSIDIDYEFLIHYDTTYLVYKGTFDERGLDHTIEDINGRIRVALNPSIDTSLYASFSFFPIDSNCTAVTIDSLSSLISSACLVIDDKAFITTICGPEGCGINALSRFIRYGTTPEFSITPNPTRGTITLRSTIDIDGATIEIRNEVGGISYSSRSDIKKADGLSLDVSSLPSGSYIMLVKGHGAGVPLVIMK